jgi:hypothetical protein
VPPFRVDDGYSSSHRDRSLPVHGGGGGGGGEKENSSTRDQLLESELEKFERRFRLSDVEEEKTSESTAKEESVDMIHFLIARLSITEIGSNVPGAIFETRVGLGIDDPGVLKGEDGKKQISSA